MSQQSLEYLHRTFAEKVTVPPFRKQAAIAFINLVQLPSEVINEFCRLEDFEQASRSVLPLLPPFQIQDQSSPIDPLCSAALHPSLLALCAFSLIPSRQTASCFLGSNTSRTQRSSTFAQVSFLSVSSRLFDALVWTARLTLLCCRSSSTGRTGDRILCLLSSMSRRPSSDRILTRIRSRVPRLWPRVNSLSS